VFDLTFTSLDLPERLRRSGIAAAIVAAHGIAVYAFMTVGSTLVTRSASQPLTAHFVSQVESRPQWQPPPVKHTIPILDLQLPAAPEIEQESKAAENRAISVRAMAQEMPTDARQADVPKLISSVEYVREPAPRYPPQSRRMKEQGLVVLRVLIDEKGQACDIEIATSSGYDRLDRAAKEAVARAEFRPYVEDGAPRRALVLIPIEFSLNRGTV
jgi:protein TonB